MKVYLVWFVDKKKGSTLLLDIYQDSEKALARVKKEKERIHRDCLTAINTVVMETRYALL